MHLQIKMDLSKFSLQTGVNLFMMKIRKNGKKDSAVFEKKLTCLR